MLDTLNDAQKQQSKARVLMWDKASPKPTEEESKLWEISSAQDQAVHHLFSNDGTIGEMPDLGPLHPLQSWEEVASTLWKRIETLSDFNPSTVNFDPIAWGRFRDKFTTCPLLLSIQAETYYREVSSTAFHLPILKLVESVADLAFGDFKDALISSIKSATELAVDHHSMHGVTKRSYVGSGVLAVYEGSVYLGVFRYDGELEKTSNDKYDKTNENVQCEFFFGQLDPWQCLFNAGTILGWSGQTLNHWDHSASAYGYSPNRNPGWDRNA